MSHTTRNKIPQEEPIIYPDRNKRGIKFHRTHYREAAPTRAIASKAMTHFKRD